jgi:hypothetical protein
MLNFEIKNNVKEKTLFQLLDCGNISPPFLIEDSCQNVYLVLTSSYVNPSYQKEYFKLSVVSTSTDDEYNDDLIIYKNATAYKLSDKKVEISNKK